MPVPLGKRAIPPIPSPPAAPAPRRDPTWLGGRAERLARASALVRGAMSMAATCCGLSPAEIDALADEACAEAHRLKARSEDPNGGR